MYMDEYLRFENTIPVFITDFFHFLTFNNVTTTVNKS